MNVGERFNPHKRFRGIFVLEAICKYRGLSAGAKLVYGRLCRYAGEDGKVFPATETLAEEVGISERQAREYIQELERGKFIEVDRENKHYRKDGSGGTMHRRPARPVLPARLWFSSEGLATNPTASSLTLPIRTRI